MIALGEAVYVDDRRAGGRAPGCQRLRVLAVPLLIGGKRTRTLRLSSPERAGFTAFDRWQADGRWDRACEARLGRMEAVEAPERSSLSAESSVSSLRMHTTSSVSLSPAIPTTGLQHRRVQTQTLAAAAVLQKEFPSATKSMIQRVLSEAKCDVDVARMDLEVCCFPGDTVVVHGEGWKGELAEFVEYVGQNIKITYKGKAYTVDQAQCRVFARADGTILFDDEQQDEGMQSEADSLPGPSEEESGEPLPQKKFALWVDPNQDDGTFRYRPEHYDEPGVGGFVGMQSTQSARRSRPASLTAAKARLRV